MIDPGEIKNAMSVIHSINDDDQLFNEFILEGKVLDEYKELLEYFRLTQTKEKVTNQEKGKCLEKLVEYISIHTNLFEPYRNIRTSTNEIDLLLKTKPGIGTMILKEVLNLGDVICECKNHNKAIGVTWIGKLYSLLKFQKVSIGILFSYHGFTGSGWNDGVGLCKKLRLVDDTIIINFCYDDFLAIAHGKSFLKIIYNKINVLKHDTEIFLEEWTHPAESLLERE